MLKLLGASFNCDTHSFSHVICDCRAAVIVFLHLVLSALIQTYP